MANNYFGKQGTFATGLMKAGVRATHRGAAAAASALMSPTQQAAYMQQGIAIGNEAAQAIQNHFWQEQWKQFYDLNIVPRIDELRRVQEQYTLDTKMIVRPVPTVMTPEETAELAASIPSGRTETQPGPPIPGTGGGEGGGAPTQSRVAVPVPTESPAMKTQEMGAKRYEEKLSFLDPEDPENPFAADSAQGIAYANRKANDAWAANTRLQQEIAAECGRLAFNPVANAFLDGMYQNLIKQSNYATTARMDPNEAIAEMDARREREADWEIQQQTIDQNEMIIARERARIAQKGNAARALLGTSGGEAFAKQLGPKLAAKLQN
ncbi:MAG: hypothetical protein ACYS5V_16775, partial [Planctomycetota bacterium]